MVEKLVKTLKHGLTILSTDLEHAQDWDKHLTKIMFRYRCGVQVKTKFSPHMLLVGRIPRLRIVNSLILLVQTYDDDDDDDLVAIATWMIGKL
jgi:hypothetical protein